MKLKPCPFCGSEVSVWNCGEPYEYLFCCKKCGAEVTMHYEVCDEAEAAWNRRANHQGRKHEPN